MRVHDVILVTLVLFFLIFGCIAPKFQSLPCCDKQHVLESGTCALTSSDPSVDTHINHYCLHCQFKFCAIANTTYDSSGHPTISYLIWKAGSSGWQKLDCKRADLSNPEDPCNNIGFCLYENATDFVSFPICSQRKGVEACTKPNCSAMMCGNIAFAPRKTFLPYVGVDVSTMPMEAIPAIGLYHANCKFFQLVGPVVSKLKQSSGVVQNIFRFGVGDSISDFEIGKWYFPPSDYIASSLPPSMLLHKKDRFTNYLCAEKQVVYSEKKYMWRDCFHPPEKGDVINDWRFSWYNPAGFDNLSFWAGDFWVFPPLDIPGRTPGENTPYTEGVSKVGLQSGFAIRWITIGGPIASISRITLDIPFYRNALLMSGIYFDPNKEALFECNDAMDCASGYCERGLDTYERGICKTRDGTNVTCFCVYTYDNRGRKIAECWPVLTDRSGNPSPWHGRIWAHVDRYDFVKTELIEDEDVYVETGQPEVEITLYTRKSVPSPPIVFFNQPQRTVLLSDSSAVGYAFMSESEFKHTAFYQACHPDYKAFNIVVSEYFDWGSGKQYYTIDLPSFRVKPPDNDVVNFWCPSKCWGFSQDSFYHCCLGHYPVYSSFIVIKDLGNCEASKDSPSLPDITRIYGWCNPQTFLSFVVVNLDDIVNNHYARSTATTVPVEKTVPKDGCGAAFGLDKKQGRYIKQYIASVEAFRNVFDQYLKQGIMPVVWYPSGPERVTLSSSGSYTVMDDVPQDPEAKIGRTKEQIKGLLLSSVFFYSPDFESFFDKASAGCSSSEREVSETASSMCDTYRAHHSFNYRLGENQSVFFGLLGGETGYDMTCAFSASYPVLKRFIGNSASIVIISSSNDSVDTTRAGWARRQCPRCLIAHHCSSPGCNAFNDAGFKSYYDLAVWDYTFGGNIAISVSSNNTEYGEALLEDLCSKSATILQNTRKPSLVFLHINRPGLIWRKQDEQQALAYILYNKERLVKCGIIGIILRDWTTRFVSVEGNNVVKAQDMMQVVQPPIDTYYLNRRYKTVIVKVPTQNIIPECQPCSKIDPEMGTCTQNCLTMRETASSAVPGNPINCTVPSDDSSSRYGFKCGLVAVNSSSVPCADCNDLLAKGWKIKCTYSYPDGHKETKVYCSVTSTDPTCTDHVSDLSLYPQVIAGLPVGKHCCLRDFSGSTYTYYKIDSKTLLPTPIIMPANGNQNVECGAVGEGKHIFCAQEIPEKDYLITCSWAK